MKLTHLFCIVTAVFISCHNPKGDTTARTENPSPAKPAFDSILANELGADKYGMKKYILGWLKRGPNRNISQDDAQQLQRAHLENIKRLAEEGLLVLAGPFLDTGNVRGIYVFDVSTVEEAESLVNTDPAIQEGSLVIELHPWYGSAALMKVNDIHTRVAKESV